MFKIETGNKIVTINGDTGYFNIIVDDYAFVDGDMVTFTAASSQNYRSPNISKSIIKGKENLDEDGDVMGYFNEDGSCTFLIHSKDTALLNGDYMYDVQLNLADGRVDTIIGPSTLTVKKGVTHKKTIRR